MKNYVLITTLLFILAFIAGMATTSEAEAYHSGCSYCGYNYYGTNYFFNLNPFPPSHHVRREAGRNFTFDSPELLVHEPDRDRRAGSNILFGSFLPPDARDPDRRPAGSNFTFVSSEPLETHELVRHPAGKNIVLFRDEMDLDSHESKRQNRRAGVNYTF